METRPTGGVSAPSKGSASHSPHQKSPKQLCRKLPHLLVIFILFVVQNSENQNRLKPLERVEGGARHGPRDRNPDKTRRLRPWLRLRMTESAGRPRRPSCPGGHRWPFSVHVPPSGAGAAVLSRWSSQINLTSLPGHRQGVLLSRGVQGSRKGGKRTESWGGRRSVQ